MIEPFNTLAQTPTATSQTQGITPTPQLKLWETELFQLSAMAGILGKRRLSSNCTETYAKAVSFAA